MANKAVSPDDTHAGFNARVRAKNLVGYWMIPNRTDGFREPSPSYSPFLWDWEALHDALYEAVENIPPEEAIRRFVGCQHPDIEIGTSTNLIVGAQLILAGETAPPHRHTMDAVRFVVEGDGEACTVVEGEEFPMGKWDLITTPNWSWHEHVNASRRDTIWLDCAVAPLVKNLNISFGEPHQGPHQDRVVPTDWSRRQFGPLCPREPSYSTSSRRPPYRYTWEDASRALGALARTAGDPCDDLVLHYADPITGGPTLMTMDCELRRLRPGFKGRRERHTHAEIYHVLEGTGMTRIGDRNFDWTQGDTFVVPLWTWHDHENRSESSATLLTVSDKPVMQALGFDRHEIDR